MTRTLTAFAGDIWIGTGDEAEIRAAVLALGDGAQNVLLFDDATGRQVDIDLHGGADAFGEAPRGRGRPKLGVQPREVTLLPRHWDWLATQPGGASATLRKLVEVARKAEAGSPTPRAAMDAAYHFMTAMAGDRAGYEAAIRALYARDAVGFADATEGWVSGVRDHARGLAGPAFG